MLIGTHWEDERSHVRSSQKWTVIILKRLQTMYFRASFALISIPHTNKRAARGLGEHSNPMFMGNQSVLGRKCT